MNMVLNVFLEGDELPSGTSLQQGHFTILSTLHTGGFGVAYMARDLNGAKVVIKECFPDAYCKRQNGRVVALSASTKSEFQTIQKQFQAEARTLAQFDHANIIGIQNLFDENGTSYMVLDYIEGRDLLDVISEPDQLSPHQITDILCETLRAVAYVHEQGFLHGDISPDNILVADDGTPYLIDFGTARPIELSAGDKIGMPVMRAVKDGYSPQELYVAGGKIGTFSDIYSLAASFYQVITRSRPADAQQRLKAISRQQSDPYVRLSEISSDYPKAFSDALDTALSAFPRRRQQAANDWLDVIATQRPEADLIQFPHAHTHSPKGTGIYRSLGT